MGTNYYLKSVRCEHCNRGSGDLHIGKSSGGWTFALRIYPADGDGEPNWRAQDFDGAITAIESLDDWRPLFAKYGIVDEYGHDVSEVEMLACITERSHPSGLLRRNGHSNTGLLGAICPPNVTYDLVPTEFS
jgi:hypothetical protein